MDNIVEANNDLKEITSNEDFREGVMFFEEAIKSTEGSFEGDHESCPLIHSFADGMYVREIRIPAGMYITGKIHNHSHPNFLMSGIVDVVTEEGKKRLHGPLSMISEAGTKRALYAVTDIVWITVHLNPKNTMDLSDLEKRTVSHTYSDYDNYIKNDSRLLPRLANKLIKLISR